MRPPDERDRACVPPPATADDGSAESSIASVTGETPTDGCAEVIGRNVLLAQICALGPAALYAASLGWRLGRLDAEEIAKQQIAAGGRQVVASMEWRALRRQPQWTEVQQRRGECARRHRLNRCTCADFARTGQAGERIRTS